MMGQETINIFFGAAFSLLGWFGKELWSLTKGMKDDLSKLREELAKDYVRKDDYKAVINKMFDKLDMIYEKLDTKQDK